jgi:creatinine amidohydrolase/Fe(II)-dependent formamide hydrolase-like protein
MDIFSMDFGSLLEQPGAPRQGGELNTSLLLHLAPELVRMELITGSAVGYPTIASAQKGARLYRFILDRISTCLDRA